MAADVATVGPDAPLPEVVRLLLTRGVKAVPVVAADGGVLGLITGGDLLTRGGMSGIRRYFATVIGKHFRDGVRDTSVSGRRIPDETPVQPAGGTVAGGTTGGRRSFLA